MKGIAVKKVFKEQVETAGRLGEELHYSLMKLFGRRHATQCNGRDNLRECMGTDYTCKTTKRDTREQYMEYVYGGRLHA